MKSRAIFTLTCCLIIGSNIAACSPHFLKEKVNAVFGIKPSDSEDIQSQRDAFVGKWYSRQPTQGGGFREATIERSVDSRYVVEFKYYTQTRQLKLHQKEFGYWGVSGGIYFTMFRGLIKNDEFHEVDPTNAYNYDAYKIEEATGNKLVFVSLTSQNRFVYEKVM